MKICFLGAKEVGKTTFLSALSCMQQDPEGAYWNFPMEKPDGSRNEDIADIRQAAESIISGEKLPPTSKIRRGAAVLHFPDQRENLHVEFIDLPGGTFSEGYDRADAQVIREIREHVNQCSCIYFFIEPTDLKKDRGQKRIATFLNVLRDYDCMRHKTRKGESPLLVCLALTKADEVYDDDEISAGIATKERVKEYFERHAGDNLKALVKQVGENNLFYAAFSTRRDGILNLNINEFTQLFSPLVRNYNSFIQKKRRLGITKVLIFAIPLIVGGFYFSSKILPELSRYRDDALVDEIKNTSLTYNNAKDLQNKVEKIKDFHKKSLAQEEFNKKLHENRQLCTEEVKNAKDTYYRNPTSINKEAYNDAVKNYKGKVSPSLPEDLKINIQVEELSAIDKILHIVCMNDNMTGYLNARSAAVQEFLNQFAHVCSDAQKIERAIETAQLMASKRKYTLKLSTSKMEDDNSLTFFVQTKAAEAGNQYPEDEEKAVKDKGFKEQAIFKENIEFDWDADKPLELHVWNDNWSWTGFSGRIVAPSNEKFPIRHFCALANGQLTDTPRDKYKKLRITSRIHCNGKELEKTSIDLVEQYIYSNDYWTEERKRIKEFIRHELEP